MTDDAEKHPWEDAAWLSRARDFARSLGIGAAHDELVVRALTHRSLAEETPLGDNERLEFLGDSVVALLVNEYLYQSFPEHAEGQLTRLKQQYVCESSLALAARGLELGPLLAMAPGDEAAGGRERASILSDSFEAILAALYLARGLDAARDFVLGELVERVDPSEVLDYKSRLQEIYQEKHRATPTYHTIVGGGPAHDRIFHSSVRAGGETLGEGAGRSKKLAEQAAAADALTRIDGGPAEP